MAPCAHCSGEIDEDGYCLGCGRRADPATVLPPPPGPPALESPQRTDQIEHPDSTWESVLSDSDLLDLSEILEDSPDGEEPGGTVVPEWHRRCGNCGWPVGQSEYGQPALSAGYCAHCGTPFSFEARLRRGDELGHYEIVLPLAHGGVGWVYLALDTHLDNRHVAIKGLINEHHPAAVEAAINERKFLITFDHENIVRILDFVIEPGDEQSAGYLVMEYVGGKSLHQLMVQAQAGQRRLPVADVVRYGLQILSALEYIHRRGYVYCDLKPDNVIHQRKRIKLIDLGAVCPIDFRGEVWGNESFMVPAEERKTRGMQPDMDLSSLGTTLAELLKRAPDGPQHSTDPALSPGVDALKLVLARATVRDWTCRFATAADMREQLDGVLRQLTALRGAELAPKPSTRFAGSADLLDDGLGRPPELDTWTGELAGEAVLTAGVLADGRPVPPLVADRLPGTVPDRTDPAAAFLAGVTTADPQRLLAELDEYRRRYPRPSTESELARCRANLALRNYAQAQDCLTQAGREAGRGDWRVLWHQALLAMHKRGITDAENHFARVHSILPGELLPRLALGYCAEHRNDPAAAARHYDVIWRTDRAEASAAFGLARTFLAEGNRD
jgi:serine/threonine-protein kinase PknG